MAKPAHVPQNFYTAKQAAARLGLKEGAFFYRVRAGKIRKVLVPGGREGYYQQGEIDSMARARELAILEHATEPSTFMLASEGDLPGLHDLSVCLFGVMNTISYERLLAWHRKNPESYYVLKQEGIVTGYAGFLYLTPENTAYIMAQAQADTPAPSTSDLLPFTPGIPIAGLFIDIAIRPDLGATQRRYHGRRLIRGLIEVVEYLATRDMPVKKLYATSRTDDGITLIRNVGFKEIAFPDDPLVRFELDLETSEAPIICKCRARIAQTLRRQRETPPS